MYKVVIVLLNFKGLKNTISCIESLRRIKKGNFEFEIIVVDNGSDDGSKEALSKLHDIQLIALEKNLGYSGGNNVGIKEALKRGSEYVLILNNDTIVEQNFLTRMVNCVKNGDIISPKIYFSPGFEFHKSRYDNNDRGRVVWYAGGKIDWENIIGIHMGVDEVDNGQFNKKMEVEYATGACMFVNSKVFEKVGFFY